MDALTDSSGSGVSGVRVAVSREDLFRASTSFILDVLRRAEASRATEVVAFETGASERIGELLFSHGEVCLVATSRGQISLGARLSRSHPDTAEEVRRSVASARRDGRPIADALRDIGGAHSDRIRAALLDQIVEGLCDIGSASLGGLQQASLSASPRHLSSVLAGFRPAVVCCRVLSRLLPVCDDAAARCYEELGPSARVAVLGARSGGDVFPVRHEGAARGDLSDLFAMGAYLRQLADPPAFLAAEIKPSLMMFGRADDAALVVSTGAQVALLGGFDKNARRLALGIAQRIVADSA
ncbi:MAG: hypothetical protein U0441_25510 [Polyangiaceae bacterium]